MSKFYNAHGSFFTHVYKLQANNANNANNKYTNLILVNLPHG